MKKSFLSIVCVVTVQFLTAQTTLNYATHNLLPGVNNPMTLCEYMEPGISGENVVWDYSSLIAIKEFTGNINMVVSNSSFSDATTELEEFGTSFFLKGDENSLQQVGYASKDMRTIVQYTEPYEKMIFPLSMGQSHASTFSGDYSFNSELVASIDGNGLIEADAWGTLKLPNNKVFLNTLRVKSVKTYTINFNSQKPQQTDVVTYRWYNSVHRYPLLVLTIYTTTTGSNVSTNYQAAYNSNAVGTSSIHENPEDSKLELFPNPARNEITLRIISRTSSTAHLQVYDITGKIVLDKPEINLLQGTNLITLDDEISRLKPGAYMLKFQNGDVVSSRQFLLEE
jgi:hypothetical protein